MHIYLYTRTCAHAHVNIPRFWATTPCVCACACVYVYVCVWIYIVERPVERVKMVTRVTTHEQPVVQNVRQPVQIITEVLLQ